MKDNIETLAEDDRNSDRYRYWSRLELWRIQPRKLDQVLFHSETMRTCTEPFKEASFMQVKIRYVKQDEVMAQGGVGHNQAVVQEFWSRKAMELTTRKRN